MNVGESLLNHFTQKEIKQPMKKKTVLITKIINSGDINHANYISFLLHLKMILMQILRIIMIM